MSRLSLAHRLPLVMAGVAALAVLIGALASWPLLTRAAEATARATLSRTADLAAELVSGTSPLPPNSGIVARLEALLSPQQVTAYLVPAGAQVNPPLTEADVAAVTSGESVSDRRASLHGVYYVEGRPITPGVGILLVQPADVAGSLARAALIRFVVSLGLGLGVAAMVGYVLARRITTPIGEAAAAAKAMSSGRRDVRIDPSGPQEVADLGEALNELSEALSESEGRQREFFLTVSHELRTPLTSIKGYAEALADGVVEPADVNSVAGIVRTEADHLDRLVADVLDLARLGAVDVRVEPVELDLADLGSDALSAWAGRAERMGIVLRDEVDRTPRTVRTDPVRVRQMLDNLMENALRVTGEGDPVVLHVGAAEQPGWFVVEVRDGGPGLTPDDLAVAFKPGELHARYRGLRKVGSGVGLALVARLALRLGGGAQAGVAPEGGASFRVLLPTDMPAQTRTTGPLPVVRSQG